MSSIDYDKFIDDINQNITIVRSMDKWTLFMLLQYLNKHKKGKISHSPSPDHPGVIDIIRDKDDHELIFKYNFVLAQVQTEYNLRCLDRYHRKRLYEFLNIPDHYKKMELIDFLRQRYTAKNSKNLVILVISLYKVGLINDPRNSFRPLVEGIKHDFNIDISYQALEKNPHWQQFKSPHIRADKQDYCIETISMLKDFCNKSGISYTDNC